MLNPFQIRDLHLCPAEENLYDSSTESVISGSPVDEGVTRSRRRRHGTIVLSAPEYDRIASDHPRARLTYIDDDDGEEITVGSAFELGQRLDDAIDTSISSSNPISPSRDGATPMHVFDIRRSKSVTELWKDVERKSSVTLALQSSPQQSHPRSDLSSNPELTATPVTQSALGESEPHRQTMDNGAIHRRWVEACSPPKLPSKEAPLSESQLDYMTLSKASSFESTTSPSRQLKEVQKTIPSSNITEEGRRQAEEAGNRLRGWRNLSLGSGAAPQFTLEHQNPWAGTLAPINRPWSPPKNTNEGRRQAEDAGSLSGTQNGVNGGNRTVPAFASSTLALPGNVQKSVDEAPQRACEFKALGVDNKQPQAQDKPEPLLSAFEAEMAKMLESRDTEVLEEPPISTPHAEDRPQSSESHQRLSTADILTQLLRNVAGGIESLGSELKSKIPEVERQFSNAQKAIPETLGANLQTAFSSLDSHLKNLANIAQDASIATGHAAERVRQAELRSAEELIHGLGNMAEEFTELGKTLYAAFEAEFGRRHSGTQTEAANETASHRDDGCHETVATGEEAPAAKAESLSSDNDRVTNVNSKADVSQIWSKPSHETMTAPSVAPPPRVAPPPPPKTPAGPIPIERPGPPAYPFLNHVSNTRPFFNWPNRPAFVPSATGYADMFVASAATKRDGHLARPGPSVRDHEADIPQKNTNSEIPSRDFNSLFIGNVSFNVTEKILEDVFSAKGFVAQVHLPADSKSGKHAGFGYAKFHSAHSAKVALEALQGVLVDGHSINVEISDNSPIDTLAQAPVPDRGTRPAFTKIPPPVPAPQLRHRQSWHPTSSAVRQPRPYESASSENLPKVFSGNSRSNSVRSDSRAIPRSSQLEVRGDREALLDHSEESAEFAARYPSLLPTQGYKTTSPSVPDRLMTVSPNSEMARFPPVSQLDAHLLANQYRFASDTDHQHGSPSAPSGNAESTSHQKRPPAPDQPVPDQRNPFLGLRHRVPAVQQPGALPYSRTRMRRSHPMIPASADSRRRNLPLELVTRGEPAPIRPLRRSATENHSLRHRAHENSWATRPTSLIESERRPIPGSFPSFPADEPTPTTDNVNDDSLGQDMKLAIKRSIIDNCVDTLTILGYGAGLDGGRQRLSIYAEAADGKLSEAIDMIEEERSAYEQHDSNA